MNAEILDLKSHIEKLTKDLKMAGRGNSDIEE